MTTALGGIQVLDLSTGLAGAIASMVLADNGAEVVKVEPPGGDPDRAQPAWVQWHRGQQSVELDLKTDAGRARARALATNADVLITSWRPGVAERLGLGYDELAVENPGLVHCSITGFGPKGPLAGVKGYDAVVGAKAGVMVYGDGDRPRFAAIPGASYAAAMGALQGILAAIYVRGNTGAGQQVEASLVQGLSGYELYQWLGPQLPKELAEVPRAGSTFSPVSGVVGFTKDGRWMQFANFRPHLVVAFLEATELTAQYEELMARKATPQEINEVVLRRLHEKTLDEWMEIFLRSDDIGIEPFRTPMEALDHPQMLHNGHVLDVVDPALGKTRQVGPLARLHGTPAEPKEGAPRLGQHNDSATFTRTTAPAAKAPVPTNGPLEGVTVVELAWFYAAPFGTALLADLGARVIKLEGAEGDPHRYQNPMREFSGVKALGGKESIVVDYRTPEGKEILHKIVANADMVMRNYRQQNSVLTGDDYESLKPHNPEQIYLYAGAYGSDGPYTTRPAFAPTMGVAAGHRGYQLGWQSALHHTEEITFDEGMKRLAAMRVMSGGPTNNADAAAGLSVATGMMLGLVARQRTGHGQYSETTMLCSNAYVVSDEFFDYDGRTPHQHHDENGVSALYRLYPAKEGWVFLAAPMPKDWAGVAAAFGLADALKDDDSALAAAITDKLAARTAAEWEADLLAQDVTCVEVSRTPLAEFTISSPTFVENGFTDEVTHTLFGTHRRHGPIATLSATPGVVGPGCLVGEQTKKILGELGYTDEQMADLKARNIVSWPED